MLVLVKRPIRRITLWNMLWKIELSIKCGAEMGSKYPNGPLFKCKQNVLKGFFKF